jgi:hypothetical protein
MVEMDHHKVDILVVLVVEDQEEVHMQVVAVEAILAVAVEDCRLALVMTWEMVELAVATV